MKSFGDAELKMKTCPRQLGDKDCGVFTIANCAAIVHGINLEGIKFLQDNMRQHFLRNNTCVPFLMLLTLSDYMPVPGKYMMYNSVNMPGSYTPV